MLNPKLIASGVGLFGFGALFGWAITADRMESKVRLALADFEDIQESLRKKIRQNMELEEMLERLQEQRIVEAFETQEEAPNRDEELSAVGSEVEEVKESEEEYFSPEETIEETRTNLQSLIDGYVGTDEDMGEYVERAVIASSTRVPPFVISREKYSWDEEEGDEYSKITLSYFPDHRVLLDDAEDPVDDIDNYVGFRNMRRFGDESGDPDVVFIRNRRLETDFEVVRKDGDELPTHIRFGMGRDEFETNKAAGLIKFREEDV